MEHCPLRKLNYRGLRGLLEKINGSANYRLRRWSRNLALTSTPARLLSDGERSSFELLELISTQGIKCIWDVGAANGSWSVLAASMFPSAQVHAFEPQPAQADSIRRLNVNTITVHQIGLGDADGSFELHITDNLDSSSLMRPASKLETVYGVRPTAKIEVDVRQPSSLIEAGVDGPDILKLDVQGFELKVLDGFGSHISRVKYIIMEIANHDFYDGQAQAAELLKASHDLGFQLHAFGAGTSLGKFVHEFDILLSRRSDL
jgi:FkbM family methyltransferase